jgi:hypothetical protein
MNSSSSIASRPAKWRRAATTGESLYLLKRTFQGSPGQKRRIVMTPGIDPGLSPRILQTLLQHQQYCDRAGALQRAQTDGRSIGDRVMPCDASGTLTGLIAQGFCLLSGSACSAVLGVTSLAMPWSCRDGAGKSR